MPVPNFESLGALKVTRRRGPRNSKKFAKSPLSPALAPPLINFFEITQCHVVVHGPVKLPYTFDCPTINSLGGDRFGPKYQKNAVFLPLRGPGRRYQKTAKNVPRALPLTPLYQFLTRLKHSKAPKSCTQTSIHPDRQNLTDSISSPADFVG